MEANDFQPRSEPTDRQRKFFSDTAYADDEVQLRRTILARIATFDTSVKDPTDDQLSETASFLNAVLESDWCKNDWERNSVAKLAKAVEASVGAEPVEPKAEPLEAREPEPLQANAAMGGGETDEDEDLEKPLAPEPPDEQKEGRSAESGSGLETARYNEDGSYAGSDYANGSYSAVSGSGEIVRYGADGSYLGATAADGTEKTPLQNGDSATPAADAALAHASRLQATVEHSRKLIDEVYRKYGLSDEVADSGKEKPAEPQSAAEPAAADPTRRDNPDGSYTITSEGSGEVARYAADGSYLGSTQPEKPADAVVEAQATQPKKPADAVVEAQATQPEKPADAVVEAQATQPEKPADAVVRQTTKPSRGAYSDIWTGGEEGVGRRLTKREAEWTRARIDSGASVSDQQLAMFGLSRNEQGQIVDGGGEPHQGFDGQGAVQTASADAGLDQDDRKRRRRRRRRPGDTMSQA